MSAPVRIVISATFVAVQEWDPDDYEVPIEDILAAARENPDDWAVGTAIDDGLMTDFTIRIDTLEPLSSTNPEPEKP